MNKQYELPLLPARSMYYTGLYLGCAYVFQVSGDWLVTLLVWLATLQFYVFDRHARGICLDIWWLVPVKVLTYLVVVIGGTICIQLLPGFDRIVQKNVLNSIGLVVELVVNIHVFRAATFEKYGWSRFEE